MMAKGEEEGLQKNENVIRCDYYINRKKRYCSNRATGSSSGINDSGENIIVRRCSMHTENALQDARAIDIYMRTLHTCRQILNDILAQIESTTECKDALLSDTSAVDRFPIVYSNSYLTQSKKRVSAPKRMANPFSIDLTPTLQEADLDWGNIFSNPHLPLHIDVGCARGHCLERLSKRPERRSWNHLGIEIRSAVVAQAIAQLDSGPAEHRNLHFLACNFAASAEQILSSLPRSCLRLVSFQFPDPWRRSKHKKRLIVQPLLVTLLRKHLPVGAAVYLSSDCKLIAESMREQFLTPIDIAGPVSVDNEDEGGEGGDDDGGSNTAAAACSRPDDVSAVTASSGGQQCQFRLVLEDEMPQQGGGGGGGGSRENPVLLMDENAFLCKSTLLQTAQEDATTSSSSSSISRDGWISFNPLGEPSEREQVCEVSWRPVYRSVLVAVQKAAGPDTDHSTLS